MSSAHGRAGQIGIEPSTGGSSGAEHLRSRSGPALLPRAGELRPYL